MTNEPPPTSWDIYLARHAPAKWIRTVEAADADAAIKEPAEQFNGQDVLLVPQCFLPCFGAKNSPW